MVALLGATWPPPEYSARIGNDPVGRFTCCSTATPWPFTPTAPSTAPLSARTNRTDPVGTALDMRQGQADNDVFARLAADPRLGLTEAQLASLVAEPITFTGAAVDQVEAVVRRVAEVSARHPAAAAYSPGSIL